MTNGNISLASTFHGTPILQGNGKNELKHM